jgi:ribosomal-protein-serine acetyltransferase
MSPVAPRRPPELVPVPDRIEGERIVLRPYGPADAPALFKLVNASRKHLFPWLPWADSDHRTLDDTRAFVARATAWWTLRTSLIVGIFDRKSGKLLGGSGLHAHKGASIDWDIPALMIGYWLGKPHEGKGYVAEAVGLLTRVAFDRFHVKRLEIKCDERNVRSARVMERAGFVREGVLRNDFRTHRGEIRSTLVYSLTPDDPRPPARARAGSASR